MVKFSSSRASLKFANGLQLRASELHSQLSSLKTSRTTKIESAYVWNSRPRLCLPHLISFFPITEHSGQIHRSLSSVKYPSVSNCSVFLCDLCGYQAISPATQLSPTLASCKPAPGVCDNRSWQTDLRLHQLHPSRGPQRQKLFCRPAMHL